MHFELVVAHTDPFTSVTRSVKIPFFNEPAFDLSELSQFIRREHKTPCHSTKPICAPWGPRLLRPPTHAYPWYRSRKSVTPQKQAVPRPAEATSLPPHMFINVLNIRPLTSISIRPAPKMLKCLPTRLEYYNAIPTNAA